MSELAVSAPVAVRSSEIGAIVTLGPESAAALGVPVGTTIDYGVLCSWHWNPVVRLARRLTAYGKPRNRRDIELARRHQALVRETQGA